MLWTFPARCLIFISSFLFPTVPQDREPLSQPAWTGLRNRGILPWTCFSQLPFPWTPIHSWVVMPLIHNLILSVQALIARQLRSHFTDEKVEAPGKEAIYQTEHLLIIAEPRKRQGGRHQAPRSPQQTCSPECVPAPWMSHGPTLVSRPIFFRRRVRDPNAKLQPPLPRLGGMLKPQGPSPQNDDPKVPHPLLPLFLSMTLERLEKHLQQGSLIPGRASAGQAAREGTAFGGQASFAAYKL